MKEKLRALPKVDKLMLDEEVKGYVDDYGQALVLSSLRQALDEIRQLILAGQDVIEPRAAVLELLPLGLKAAHQAHFRPIINATGIVLHTNMGRALLSEEAADSVYQAVSRYNNLELDLDSGKRGSRYDHVVSLLKKLTGCEDALVVNNNAAAVLLALNTLGEGRQTLLSRGEMVEIGGSFRVPEVMKMSGTRLVEVGTTNKTHLYDYEEALGPETAVILKVHTSNYTIKGFSQAVSTADLVELAHKEGLVVYEDLGSGFLADLSASGITSEPRVQEALASGVDVLSFSGDKLLGGPQAGILVGKKDIISKMKKNQLTRALRIDKMTVAALEATLRSYLDMDRARQEIPTLRMLSMPRALLKKRAQALHDKLTRALGPHFSVEEDVSLAGGGSLPDVSLPTYVVRYKLGGQDEEVLTSRLRRHRPSVMCRKNKQDLIFDVRTLSEKDLDELTDILLALTDPRT